MEIRVLRYFLETAREGNMTRAAQRLFISQPTMSKQLKELEKELGTKLFVRTNYNIRLTEAGLLLRERAEDIISLVDKTEAEFKAFTSVPRNPRPWGSSPRSSAGCRRSTRRSAAIFTAATYRMSVKSSIRDCWILPLS